MYYGPSGNLSLFVCFLSIIYTILHIYKLISSTFRHIKPKERFTFAKIRMDKMIALLFYTFKRLQILQSFAGTFAEIYCKKTLAMWLFSNIFAAENQEDARNFLINRRRQDFPLLLLDKEFNNN